MKNLRALGTIVLLTSLLCISAFVIETSASACGPLNPGQVETPPCAITQAPSSADSLGQIETPPSARDEAYMTEIASFVLFSILSLF